MSASLDDVVSALSAGNKNTSLLIQTVTALGPAIETIGPALASVLGANFKFGSFTCAANTNTTVSDASTAANSVIIPIPTNAAAGTLMGGTRSLYLSARTAGTSFRFTTASGVAAAGTETFIYVMINPA